MSTDAGLPHFLGGPPEGVVTEAARPAPRPTDDRVPGEPGLWLFLLGDMTLFGAFFVGFLVYRIDASGEFRESAGALTPGLGSLNTIVLLTSSLLMAATIRALRGGRERSAIRRLLVGVMACATVFAVIKVSEYAHLISDGHTPPTTVFFTLYFALTGIHLLHLVVGGGLVVGLLRVLAVDPDPWSRAAFARGVASYWHMVDLLWVVLFPLLYLVPSS